MITSTNPVVANALGINSGVALNERTIQESREFREAYQKWMIARKPLYALVDYLKNLRVTGSRPRTRHSQVGCKAIRIDTWAGNKPAASLYRKMGFRFAGAAHILLSGLIPEEQVFFELSLEGSE